MDEKDQQGEDSKNIDRGKRKVDGKDVQKSQEHPFQALLWLSSWTTPIPIKQDSLALFSN